MDYRQTLPAGTVLDGKYRIERILGAGGFGITYQAFDERLTATAAIKEYFPSQFGVRDATNSVRPRSEVDQDIFDRLRSSFVREARTLNRFDHPSIVRVLNVFEEYGTAYMVMKYEMGPSLKTWLAQLKRLPTQAELDRLAAPLLDALDTMHAAEFLHRDIAPDNIIVRADGTPVLLDFGASRRVMGEMTGTLTGVVKKGYSPQEQYTTDGRSQGPWTDIYALGATLYRCISDETPDEATERMLSDTLLPAFKIGAGIYRTKFLEAIDAAMSLRPSERPQSISSWRRMLLEGAGGRSEQFHPRPTEIRTELPQSIAQLSRNTPSLASAPNVACSRTPLAALVGFAALIVAGVAFATQDQWLPKRINPAIAQEETDPIRIEANVKDRSTSEFADRVRATEEEGKRSAALAQQQQDAAMARADEAARIKAAEEERQRLDALAQQQDAARARAEEAARIKAAVEERQRLDALAQQQDTARARAEEAARIKAAEEERRRLEALAQQKQDAARARAEETARVKTAEEERKRLASLERQQHDVARKKVEKATTVGRVTDAKLTENVRRCIARGRARWKTYSVGNGAIAIGDGHCGFSWRYKSQEEADNRALKECRRKTSNCRIFERL